MFPINLSLSYFVVSLISTSPYLTRSHLCHYSHNSFNYLQISNFSNSFYYSNVLIQSSIYQKSSHVFTNSKFDHLLNHAIKIEFNSLYDKILNNRSFFKLEFMEISNCIFSNIDNRHNTGGAIMTFSGLKIINSLFYNCYANTGGCFTFGENLTLIHVTFADCKARTQCGVFERNIGPPNSKSDIKLCIFLNCQAKFYGCFRNTNQNGTFIIYLTNISQTRSFKYVGCFEIFQSSSTIQFLIITKSQSFNNGCIVAKKLASLIIYHCLFDNYSEISPTNKSAAALCISQCPPESIISNCFFSHRHQTGRSYSILVKKGKNKIRILKSFFSREIENEIFQNHKVVVDDSVKFKVACNYYLDDILENCFNKQNKSIQNIKFNKKDNYNSKDKSNKEKQYDIKDKPYVNESNTKCTYYHDIVKWKSKFLRKMMNDSFGCLTINFLEKIKEKPQEVLEIDENEKDFIIIHIFSIILSFILAFLLQQLTSRTSRL